MKTNKFILVNLVISSLLMMNGCFVTDMFKSTPDVIIPEMVISPDASIFLTFDHSDKEQVAAFSAILNKFSGIKLPADFISKYNETVPKELSYENLKSVLNGDYKISIGAKLPDKIDMVAIATPSGFDISKISGLDLVIAGTFSDSAKVEGLITSGLNTNGISPVEENGYKTWTVLKPQIYIVKKDSLFFVTFSKETKDAAIKRFEEGTGLDKSEMIITSLSNLSEKHLGYLYLDVNKVQNLALSAAPKAERDAISSSPAGLYKSVFSVLVAEKDGVKVISRVIFKNDSEMLNRYFPSNEISLVNKVPGENLIMYAEMPPVLDSTFEELSRLVSQQAQMFAQPDAFLSEEDTSVVPVTSNDNSLIEDVVPPTFKLSDSDSQKIAREDTEPAQKISRVKPKKEYPTSTLVMPSSGSGEEEKEIEKIETEKKDCIVGESGATDCVESPLSFEKPEAIKALDMNSAISSGDVYGSIIDQLSKITEVSKEDLKGIIASPYAVAVYDTGTLIPGIAIYFQVADKYQESAKKLVSVMSTYMDQVLLILDERLKEQSGVSGIIKKDVKVIGGSGIQKIYVDWEAVPKDLIRAGSVRTRFDISKTKLEFYYGIFGDNVMAFALYPNFADSYGKKVVSDMDYFNDAKVAIKTIYGYKINILKVDTFLNLIVDYIGISGMGFLSLDTMEKVTAVLKEFTKIEYIVDSSVKEGQNFLKSVIYIKVGDETKDIKVDTPLPAPEDDSVKEVSAEKADGVVYDGPDQDKIDGAKKIAELIGKNADQKMTGGGCVFKATVLGNISSILKANTDEFKNVGVAWQNIKKTAMLGTICEGGYTVLVDKDGSKYGVFIKVDDEKNGNMACSDVTLGVDSTKLVDMPADLGMKGEGNCYVAM